MEPDILGEALEHLHTLNTVALIVQPWGVGGQTHLARQHADDPAGDP